VKIPRKRHDAITHAIRTLYERSIAFQTTKLERQDVLHLFVRPEHRAAVVQIVHELELMDPIGTTEVFSTTAFADGKKRKHLTLTVGVRFSDREATRFVVPAYAGEKLHDDTEEAKQARKKVEKWMERRIKTARDFGLVQAVWDHMALHFDTLPDARFFWEPIQTFLYMDDDAKSREMADKMRTPKLPTNIPSIPPELRKAFADTAATVARAQMLPKDGDVPVEPVHLLLANYDTGEVPWLEGKPLPRF
jgi:hypothetical protein